MSGSHEMGTNCPSRRQECRMNTEFGAARKFVGNAIGCVVRFSFYSLCLIVACIQVAGAQTSLTWEQVKAKFEAANPALRADADNVDEMRAEEITAYLRPNPQLTVGADGTQIAPNHGVWQPFRGTDFVPNIS